MSNILTTLSPILSEVLTSVILAVLIYGTVLLKKWLIQRMGVEQYNAAKDMAYGIWIELEEHMPTLIGPDKMAQMKDLLAIEFPLLSDAQLTAINKEVHNRMQYMYEPAKAEEN
jgi:hypothetical protein